MRQFTGGLVPFAVAAIVAAGSACGNFDVTNPNNPSVGNLLNNPSRAQIAAAATGIFITARGDAAGSVWILGALGREGAKLDGNNQPDYQETFYGPLSPSGIGGAFWTGRYANIRSINIFLDALSAAKTLSAEEIAASRGMAKTMKALALLFVVRTHGSLGAPVDVNRPLDDPEKAPFVAEDSVYGYIVGQLDSAKTELSLAGSASFPFLLPPGFTSGGIDFTVPADFLRLNRALKAKALVMRATAGCGAPCFASALVAVGESFIDDAGSLEAGAYFDFSSRSGDTGNGLSDPIGGTTYFALESVLFPDAQLQPGGAPDQRVLDKLVAATDTQRLGGIPIVGTTKFTVYLGGGGNADPSTPIPIIRNEELILLRAEAEIGTGNYAAALADLNLVRARSGHLGPASLTVSSPKDDFITELLYNRRYSLLWEQGTTWVDARRYGRLSSIPPLVDGGAVPALFPIPQQECSSRGLSVPCNPLGTG